MRPGRIRTILSFLVVIGICDSVFLLWKRGTPYQQPYWSPNHQYYVQKYSNFSLSGGRGSDSISGYIRVYSRDGKMLHERYQTFIRDVDPVWAGNKLYLRGIAEMDNDPWLLPSSSEPPSSE